MSVSGSPLAFLVKAAASATGTLAGAKIGPSYRPPERGKRALVERPSRERSEPCLRLFSAIRAEPSDASGLVTCQGDCLDRPQPRSPPSGTGRAARERTIRASPARRKPGGVRGLRPSNSGGHTDSQQWRQPILLRRPCCCSRRPDLLERPPSPRSSTAARRSTQWSPG